VKVDPRATSFAVAPPDARPFREVLARAPAAAPLQRVPALAHPPAARASAAVAAHLLSRVEAEPADLEFIPAAEDPAPGTRRLLELITQELDGGLEGGGSTAANDLPFFLPGAAPPADDPRQQHLERSAAAVALIEKIQVFVRHGQRPILALTLDNALAARVEIERLGPGRVALRMVGHRGPPCPEAVSRVRDELLARGLKVAAISVA
jgi:hypothetical protein